MKAILVIPIAVLAATLPIVVSAQNSLFFTPNVRAMGMGETGVADVSDPANTFYNPAVAAWTDGVHLLAMYKRSRESFAPEVHRYGALLSAGWRWNTSESDVLSLGVGLSFSNVDYGTTRLYDSRGRTLATDHSHEHSISFISGMSFGGGPFDAGIGFAVKPWTADYGFGLEASQTYFDAGFRLEAGVGDPGELQIALAFALSALNIGDTDVEFTSAEWTGSQKFYLAIPRSNRMGVSLRVDGPSTSSYARRKGVAAPTMAMVFNLELEDNLNTAIPDLYTVGAELAMHGVLFVRVGQAQYLDCSCMTAGIGFGHLGERFSHHFDFALLPFWGEPRAAFDCVQTQSRASISLSYRY